MKRFLKTISLLLCVLLVLNVVLDFAFTFILNHSQASPYKDWNSIIHNTIDADLLVMGSSRAWVQYDPRIMDSLLPVNSYNIGANGGHIKRQVMKYEIYRHYQKKKPSLLIVNLDFLSTCWHRESGFERKQYFPHLTNLYFRGLLRTRKQEHFSKGELYLPMYRYYSQGFSTTFKSPYNDECWYKGYYWGMPPEWDGTILAQIKTLKFEPTPDVVEAFDSFLSELQEDSIKVIFVCSPIYIEATEKTINLSEFYDFQNYFSEKYDIPMLDYIHAPLCYDTVYFFNATHLNKTGAELFTKQLCHDLDSLGILKK